MKFRKQASGCDVGIGNAVKSLLIKAALQELFQDQLVENFEILGLMKNIFLFYHLANKKKVSLSSVQQKGRFANSI